MTASSPFSVKPGGSRLPGLLSRSSFSIRVSAPSSSGRDLTMVGEVQGREGAGGGMAGERFSLRTYTYHVQKLASRKYAKE